MSAIAKKIITPLQSDAAFDALFDRMEPRLDDIEARQKTPESPSSDTTQPTTIRWLKTITPAECSTGRETSNYVVKHLIGCGHHIALCGLPACGKSSLAPLLAYHIATGKPFLNHACREGTILYVASEDGAGMERRVRALREQFGDTEKFRLLPEVVDLWSNTSLDLMQISATISAFTPSVIVLDTFSRCFPGMDENASRDMSFAIAKIRQMTTICGSTVITLHHVAKGGGDTPRGHGSLHADLDALWLMSSTAAGARRIEVAKNRHGPAGEKFGMNILPATIGNYPEGDPITAPMGVVSPATPTVPRQDIPTTPAKALKVLRGLLEKSGAESVTVADWQQACELAPLSTAKGVKERNRTFRNSMTKLEDSGEITVNRHSVYLSVS